MATFRQLTRECPLESPSSLAGKILELLFNCRREIHRLKIDIETNFALADVERMRWIKISLVSEAGNRRLRTIKFADLANRSARPTATDQACLNQSLLPLAR